MHSGQTRSTKGWNKRTVYNFSQQSIYMNKYDGSETYIKITNYESCPRCWLYFSYVPMAVTCEIHWSIFHHVNCYLRWNNTSVLLGEFYDQYRRYSTAKNDFKFSHDLISEQNTRLLCASHIKWSRTQNDNEKISVSGCPKRDTRQKNLSAYRNRNTYNTRRVSRAHTRHTTHRLKCIRSLHIYIWLHT